MIKGTILYIGQRRTLRWGDSWADTERSFKKYYPWNGSWVIIHSSVRTWLSAKQTSFHRINRDKRNRNSKKAKGKLCYVVQWNIKKQAKAQDPEDQFKSPNVIWSQDINIWTPTLFVFVNLPFTFPLKITPLLGT